MKTGYFGKKLKAALDSIKSKVKGTSLGSSNELEKAVEVRMVTVDSTKEANDCNEIVSKKTIHKKSPLYQPQVDTAAG